MFDWDDGNVDHIVEEHDVTPFEVEKLWQTPTEIGRVLVVIYTERAGRIRVVTARDADDDEADLYSFGT